MQLTKKTRTNRNAAQNAKRAQRGNALISLHRIFASTSAALFWALPATALAYEGTTANDGPQLLGGLVAWILAGGGVLALIVAVAADQKLRSR